MYLIDTNVISEARKGRQANAGVVRFFLTNPPSDRYLCVQTVGLVSPQAIHPIDKQIAAIALVHGLEVVTRNVHDFTATGVVLLNPFV